MYRVLSKMFATRSSCMYNTFSNALARRGVAWRLASRSDHDGCCECNDCFPIFWWGRRRGRWLWPKQPFITDVPYYYWALEGLVNQDLIKSSALQYCLVWLERLGCVAAKLSTCHKKTSRRPLHQHGHTNPMHLREM